jgi:type IV pilus assembly protein PilA
MKNNKGFTLVELLAMLIVLGILIGISVPNITGILNQQKETAFIDEASKLVSTAQMMMSTKREIKKPKNGNCLVFSMSYLDKAGELKKSADGGEYLREESFVIVSRTGAKIEYTVRLVELTSSNDVYGVDAVSLDILEKEGTSVLGFSEEEGYNMSTATPDSISHLDPFYSMCTTIEAVYN